MVVRGPQNGRWSLERGLIFLCSHYLSLNGLFLSTPSMRKVDNGEKREEKRVGGEGGTGINDRNSSH